MVDPSIGKVFDINAVSKSVYLRDLIVISMPTY
jgi:hypothetical protein